MRPPFLLIASALLLVVLAVTFAASGAFAADDSAVYVAPLIVALKPYIDVIVQAAIGAAVIFTAGLVQKYTGVKVSQNALDKLRAAAATQAGILVAGAEDNLSKTVISVGHPKVAQAANQIIALLPDAAKAVGATPESLQTLIVGEVGKLQAISTGGPTATATASNPDGSSTTVTAKG